MPNARCRAPRFTALPALLAVIVLAAVPAPGAHAQQAHGATLQQQVPLLRLAQRTELSRDAAAAAARQATGGRILSVTRQGQIFRVRVLLDNERVRTIEVDATTGEVRRESSR